MGTVLTEISVLFKFSMGGAANNKGEPVVIGPKLRTSIAILASYPVMEKKPKVQGLRQNIGRVSYSDTRTSNAGVTNVAEERLRDGDNLVGKHGHVKGLRDRRVTVEHVHN
jgi:hypothetical protein